MIIVILLFSKLLKQFVKTVNTNMQMCDCSIKTDLNSLHRVNPRIRPNSTPPSCQQGDVRWRSKDWRGERGERRVVVRPRPREASTRRARTPRNRVPFASHSSLTFHLRRASPFARNPPPTNKKSTSRRSFV